VVLRLSDDLARADLADFITLIEKSRAAEGDSLAGDTAFAAE
jgi:hypothetical protein